MKKVVTDTIGNIYAAVGKPEAWTALMAELCSLLDATVGIWVTPGQGQRDQSFYAAHNHSDRVARAYSDYWWQHDLWLQAGYKKGLVRTGVVATGVELVSTADLHASVFYRDFLSTIPIEHLLVIMVVVEDIRGHDGSAPDFADVLPTHISFFRPPGAAPFNDEDKAILNALHPHFHRAFNMHCQWRAMQEQLNVFHTSINSMDFGVVFIDAAQRVRHANAAADSLAHKLWPGASRGIASALRQPANKQLQDLVNAAALGQGGAVKLQRANGENTMQAVAIAMTVANPGTSLAGKLRASVLLLIVDSAHRSDAAANFLSKAFALTKSESRLLPLLIKGLTPVEIAQALTLKLPTVRSQLSSIFAKTGTARQQDLMALAGSMPPVAELSTVS